MACSSSPGHGADGAQLARPTGGANGVAAIALIRSVVLGTEGTGHPVIVAVRWTPPPSRRSSLARVWPSLQVHRAYGPCFVQEGLAANDVSLGWLTLLARRPP